MYIVHKTTQAKNILGFLKNRADSVCDELKLAGKQLAKVTDINQRIIKASGRVKEAQLTRDVEMLHAIHLEIVKNLEISRMTLLNKTPIINIIDEPILPLEDDTKSKTWLGILGAFLGGFLSVSFFVFRKLFKDALNAT